MKTKQNQSGLTLVEVLLIIIALAIIGFTGWFVYHSNKTTDNTLKSTDKVGQSSAAKVVPITSFDQCKKATGSTIEQTYPEQCVSKSGKTFTDTSVSAPAAPSTTTTTKAAAESPTPAAGTCETTSGNVVMVTLTEGVSDPRCSQVTASQTLDINNPTTQSVTATLGGQSVVIPAGKTGSITTPFGDYLETGDHTIQTGLYGGSGPEIYLPAS